MMFKAYKYRIYPNKSQKELLAQHFGCARWVYNWALDKKKKHYEETKKNLSKRSLQNDLVTLKKTEDHTWLKQVNSQSLLAALLQLNTAFKNFFDKRAKYPKFKKKHNKQTYQCPQHVQIDEYHKLIHLPKIKSIKIKQHRPFSGIIKTVTLTKTPSNKYYASILIENTNDYPTLAPIQVEKTIGIDLGLTHFAITSREERIQNPNYLKTYLRELAIAQKIKSRKDYQKRSSNYKKQCTQVAKIHEKIANKRYDFIQQYTARLMCENQVTSFAVENLHIKGMIRNKRLARSISDSAWGMFLRILSYKSKLYGKNVLTIGRFVASSKTCHLCGNQKEKLPLSIRKWECACGAQHDRDINAAKVIKKQALADTLGLSDCVKSSSVTIPISVGVTARG